MNTNMFALASALSDQDLLARIGLLAGKEREATVELVAHLAALDARPSLYAARGHGSLFAYCTDVLRLSEDAVCNRISAARACRLFPMILDRLASGAVSLTSVRMLRPHLTPENHEAVLASASGKTLREIEALVAELAPRPDVPSSVRKLPAPSLAPMAPAESSICAPQTMPTISAPPPPVTHRPVVETTSPERYRVQFTMGKESHDTLRRLQDLLRREIPDGDAGAIVERALRLLLEKVEKAKFAATPKPRRAIRRGTDEARTPAPTSRDIPSEVQRGAWRRDGGQCGFVSKDGRRCKERSFLEFHHVKAYALGGPATLDNVSLRCRRHNQYEAELVFGPRASSGIREASHTPRTPSAP
jgi:5-methylcytosine-specific restriction endonuclease McrA